MSNDAMKIPTLAASGAAPSMMSPLTNPACSTPLFASTADFQSIDAFARVRRVEGRRHEASEP